MPTRALAVVERNQANVFPACEGSLLIPAQKAHLWRRKTHASLFQSLPSSRGARVPSKGAENREANTKTQARGCLQKPKQNPAGFPRNLRRSRRWESRGGWRSCQPSGPPAGMLCGGPSALVGAETMQRKRLCNGVAPVEGIFKAPSELGVRRDHLEHVRG